MLIIKCCCLFLIQSGTFSNLSAIADTDQQISYSTCGISFFCHALCIFTDSLVRLTSQLLSCLFFSGVCGHASGMRPACSQNITVFSSSPGASFPAILHLTRCHLRHSRAPAQEKTELPSNGWKQPSDPKNLTSDTWWIESEIQFKVCVCERELVSYLKRRIFKQVSFPPTPLARFSPQDPSAMPRPTSQDLAGFWDLLQLSIDDVTMKFDQLQQIKNNNWRLMDSPEKKVRGSTVLTCPTL